MLPPSYVWNQKDVNAHLLTLCQTLHPFFDNSFICFRSLVPIWILLDLPQLLEVPVEVSLRASVGILPVMVVVVHTAGHTFVSAGIQKTVTDPLPRRLLSGLHQIKYLVELRALPPTHDGNTEPCTAPCIRSVIGGQSTQRDRKLSTHTSGIRIHLEQARVNHSVMACRVTMPQF